MEALNKLLNSLSPNTNTNMPEVQEETSGNVLTRLWDKLSAPKEPSTYSRDTGIQPINRKFDEVLNRLIQAESRGKQFDKSGNLLTSPVGAEGVTQVMPKTGKKPGFGVEPMRNKSKEEFERFGRDYLQAMLNEFGGDYSKALAAYNAGHANVKKAVKEGGENWMNFLPKKEETIPYVKKILGD